ncbi:MAG: hypothetical protein A2Y03_05870 [Omnitrophica WOR_2 bacterium GWF2_38_59]|nr:MAG: hypothetical protein A2Y03_05870 [Omnitrophica WOR_2 bacterium GWF2_38_59]OGX49180.1 MAG: hypothetical protein A2243_07735 [Omnitrophica WOR_2 bacterium RIFOXYA2_FULL_38_17]OGX52656.1 MAG: hypothetical protein A2267_10825 [Omnitrophica WOR_2 bacterium RIFOXYA12_FULL_38_10]OGX56468.1 MAG: hypothetical protein A2306_11635 [Omnitrophica WOR_2 bacterium RIFOXYB2_FULL_38_16]OGX59743.1 MAG: hypothetical protein A2447_03020 [Omnitrophica WOR_2 bacterium RIFOXYC2_FULL_38_12]HBG61606.1 hypothet
MSFLSATGVFLYIKNAIHKLIVTQRRTKADKAEKDLIVAIALLHDLVSMKQSKFILEAYNSVSKK